MIKKTILPALLLGTALMFNGCTKEGPIGPQGPAGYDGNANVTSSTTTVTPGSWIWDPTNKLYYTNYNYPSITSDIDSYGAVLIYLSTASGWEQLPRTIYPDTTYNEVQTFTHYAGGFTLVIQDSDLGQSTSIGSIWTIKVVVVASSARKAHPDVNYKNYKEVKAAFNLKD